jgi:hypothetical protein
VAAESELEDVVECLDGVELESSVVLLLALHYDIHSLSYSVPPEFGQARYVF